MKRGLVALMVGGALSAFAVSGEAIAAPDSNGVIGDVRSQLSDIDRFPLSLPPVEGRIVASSEQLSSTQISSPSLSWIRDQVGKRYGSDRLVIQWQAYQATAVSSSFGSPSLSYVDVIVDEQIWSLLSYFERYAFVSQFGLAAQQYGYHLRVFHTGDALTYQNIRRDAQSASSAQTIVLRGANICDFPPGLPAASTTMPNSDQTAALGISCEIILNDTGRRDVL